MVSVIRFESNPLPDHWQPGIRRKIPDSLRLQLREEDHVADASISAKMDISNLPVVHVTRKQAA
jgi:hypothetical protein